MTPCELSPWAESWVMLGEKCGCCEGPWVHRDNHNSHMFHPHSPTIGPRTQSAGSLLHSPQGGFHQSLDVLPTDATRANSQPAGGHGGKGRPRHGVLGLKVGLGG